MFTSLELRDTSKDKKTKSCSYFLSLSGRYRKIRVTEKVNKHFCSCRLGAVGSKMRYQHHNIIVVVISRVISNVLVLIRRVEIGQLR